MTEVSSLQMIAMKLESDEQVCFFFQIFFSFHSKVQKEALLALALICSVTGRLFDSLASFLCDLLDFLP